jgi:hypothetical protein
VLLEDGFAGIIIKSTGSSLTIQGDLKVSV